MSLKSRWIPIALAAFVSAAPLPAAAASRALSVEVWTDRGDDAVYQPGEAMQVKVRANDDAYLLVYEIDSEGHVAVLYPWRRGSNLVEARRTYRLPPEKSGYELAVESATGQGYVVAIASRRPFRDLPWYLRTFDPQAEGNGYEDRKDDTEGFDESGKVVGDPMVSMERIRRRVLAALDATDDFATSYASYYVGHEVRYPRYLCSDCHRPGRWAWWDGFDPYYSRCSVFDFRVNWNWCWGPCMWGGHVPYYYYVVRSDCPPGYRGWYDDRSRWSSWDGHDRWNQLWGDNLHRQKSAPPVGYTPPPSTKPAWNPNGGPVNNPPGYLPSYGGTRRGGGFRAPMPVGQSSGSEGGSRPVWGGRGTGGGTPSPPALTPPAATPPVRTPRPTPVERPREPQSAPQPQVEPRREPREQPAPRREPERQPAAQPAPQSPPKQESPRQESPRREPTRTPSERGDKG